MFLSLLPRLLPTGRAAWPGQGTPSALEPDANVPSVTVTGRDGRETPFSAVEPLREGFPPPPTGGPETVGLVKWAYWGSTPQGRV